MLLFSSFFFDPLLILRLLVIHFVFVTVFKISIFICVIKFLMFVGTNPLLVYFDEPGLQ